MPDFQELLVKALAERAQRSPQSLQDLNAVTTELNRAVEAASWDRVRLALAPMRVRTGGRIGTALLAHFTDPDEERIIQIFEPDNGETGYPMQRWAALEDWERNRSDGFVLIPDASELLGYLKRLLSSPDSILVRLIANELAVAEAGTDAALAG